MSHNNIIYVECKYATTKENYSQRFKRIYTDLEQQWDHDQGQGQKQLLGEEGRGTLQHKSSDPSTCASCVYDA